MESAVSLLFEESQPVQLREVTHIISLCDMFRKLL